LGLRGCNEDSIARNIDKERGCMELPHTRREPTSPAGEARRTTAPTRAQVRPTEYARNVEAGRRIVHQ
jgi:hypothetical protein